MHAVVSSDAQSTQTSPRQERGLAVHIRGIVLPAMASLFALYIVTHSPVRDLLAGLFRMESRGCYFTCGIVPLVRGAPNEITVTVLLVCATAAGWIVADFANTESYEWPLAFGLATFGFLVIPAAFVAGLGSLLDQPLLRPPVGPLLSVIPSAMLVASTFARGRRRQVIRFILPKPRGVTWLVGGAAVILLVVSVVLGVTHPASGGDALSYHAPLAIFLWRDGNLTSFLGRAPGTWALAQPGAAELWSGALYSLGGEKLADLGQLPFAMLGAAAVATFTRRVGLRSGAALLAACAYLLVPMVVLQSTQQPNDVVGAALLMTVVAIGSAPIRDWSERRMALIGLGLGLATVTKLALLPGIFVIGLYALVVAAKRGNVRAFATLAISFLMPVAPWWIRGIVRYQNPFFPQALPVLGHGIVVNSFGPVDTSFVPGPLTWPLYPLLEAHDDRSGFGALFLVAALPGLVYAARRGRRQPLILLGSVTALTLPIWWVYTLHEPRFLLGIVGLTFAFVPWTLLAVPRPQRRYATVLIGVVALFSALVTFDQALLPLAQQPTDRASFYDQVWAVDPVADSLPERDGVLLETGYAPAIPEYAAYYPLLGPNQTRLVIPVDGEDRTAAILSLMREAGVRYAYIAVGADQRSIVERTYNSAYFELVHASAVVPGALNGARRHLYKQVDLSTKGATVRYLFRLR